MDKAFEWYLKAAETGNTDAFYAIGRLYETVFIKKDVRKAIQYYELASELPEACYALGRLYEFCDIIQNDNEKALKLYEKAVGIVDAEFALGLMYENGKGVDQDYDRALELYQSAADKGLVKAYAALGSIYSKMEDHESAFNWNRKAAEHGSEQGIYNLAKMIDSEEGDTKRAFDLYHKLAEGGNAYCQYLIATKYEKGIGVEQSDALAIKWFTLANKGDYKTPPF